MSGRKPAATRIIALLALAALIVLPAGCGNNDEGGGEPGNAAVIVSPVVQRTLRDPVEALGTLRANESAQLTAIITGTIADIRFEDGQRVSRGDVLVAMTNREQLAELAEAEAELDETRQQLQRIEALAARQQEAQAVLDQRRREANTARARLGAVQARLSDRLIVAPFDGTVGLRTVSVGSLLSPGDVVTTINDDSVMKLDFGVPEPLLSLIEPGMEVRALSRAFPGQAFTGEVRSLDNQLDPVTRSFQVRAELPNPDGVLRPGMLMAVTLETRERQALVVPEAAVLSSGRDHHVFVVRDNGDGTTVREQAVTLGRRSPGQVEILDGLEDGLRVVVHGGFRLEDGDAVDIRAEVDDEVDLAQVLSNDRDPDDGDADADGDPEQRQAPAGGDGQ